MMASTPLEQHDALIRLLAKEQFDTLQDINSIPFSTISRTSIFSLQNSQRNDSLRSKSTSICSCSRLWRSLLFYSACVIIGFHVVFLILNMNGTTTIILPNITPSWLHSSYSLFVRWYTTIVQSTSKDIHSSHSSSITISTDVFPLPQYSFSTSIIILLAFLYGTILAFIYAMYRQRQLQQHVHVLNKQVGILEQYHYRSAHQLTRLKQAAKHITIPYSLEALLDKNLDDFADLAPSTSNDTAEHGKVKPPVFQALRL